MLIEYNSSRFRVTLVIPISFSSQAKSHINPSFKFHESCRTYLMLHYIHITHHTIILNQNRSFRNKQASNHNTVLAQYLAQAEGSRSGEASSLRRTPFRLGEGSKEHPRINVGSRLGETPLAWARCLLAQKFERVAWATLRTNWFGRIPVCLA